MRPSTLLPALIGMATARIVGVAAPSQLAPGEHFNVTLITQNYIQAITDVSAAVGLSTVQFPDTLGTYVGSFHIGPKHSNILTNITHTFTVPETYPVGLQTNLETAVWSLYGASGSPTTIIWSLPVTIANSTGTELISTLDGANACATALPSSSSAAASATASASSTGTSPSGAGDLNTIVQSVQQGLTNLLSAIIQSNTTAARTQYTSLSSSFDEISALANQSGDSCPQPPSPGKALTQAEALHFIQGIQASLNLVVLDVKDGDNAAALRDVCAVRAAWFSSGLREFVFK